MDFQVLDLLKLWIKFYLNNIHSLKICSAVKLSDCFSESNRLLYINTLHKNTYIILINCYLFKMLFAGSHTSLPPFSTLCIGIFPEGACGVQAVVWRHKETESRRGWTTITWPLLLWRHETTIVTWCRGLWYDCCIYSNELLKNY